MRSGMKSIFYAAAAGVAAAAAGLPVNAFAQAEGGKQPVVAVSDSIEDIVVTAQRRETRLQTTAVAISALSSDALAARSIQDVESLGKLSPSMDVSIYQGEAQIYIRGIGYTGLIGGTDSSTAVHLNGIYLSRSSGAVPGFLDVERVEVVRGPQGTLYGRNATGGSVNIISKAPTDHFVAEGMATVGNYDTYQLFAAAGGPISGDMLTARLAVQMEQRDGYTRATHPNGTVRRIEDKKDVAGRLSVTYKPSDNFKIDLIGDAYRADDAGSIWLYFGPGTGTNPFLRQYISAAAGVTPTPKSRNIGSDVDPINRPLIWGISGRITWNIGDYTLTSLTGYRRTHPYNFNDLDITTADAITQFREERHRQFSQELQLSSPTSRPFEWIAGVYYFRETNDVRNEYRFPFVDNMFGLPESPTCCTLRLDGRATTRAFAAFGEANYDLTDRLNLVAGGRYSTERRGGGNDVEFVNFLTPAFDNKAAFVPATFSSFTPKAGLNYKVNENVFTYFSASRGFKSGGFNIGSYQNTPFNPEKIWSYEVGVKSDFLDRRLRFNLAAFYYDYTDLQVQDVAGNNTIVRNAANAITKGIELESTALVTPQFQLDFNATYIDSHFSDTCLADPKYPRATPDAGCTGPNQQNLQGFQLPRAPEYKFAAAAQYTIDTGNGAHVILRGDYSWQSRIYFSSFQVRELSQKSYGWLKAKATYVAPDGHWQASVYMDNVANAKVISNATYIADLVDSTITGNMAPPRTYGLQLRYQY